MHRWRWLNGPMLLQSFGSNMINSNRMLLLDQIISVVLTSLLAQVAMLFTPHEECQEEFKNLVPGRGGVLVDHLSKA